MSELIDDSILNIEEIGRAEPGINIEMNDDTIAALLSDDVTANTSKKTKEVVPTAEEAPEEMVEEVPEQFGEEVLIDDQSNPDEGFEETETAAVEAMVEEEIINDDSADEEIIAMNGDERTDEKEKEQAAPIENITLDSDDDVFGEEVLHVEEGSGDGSANRKRARTESGPTSVNKRVRRDRPFFEARKKAIDLITSLYGSWDASLTVPHLRTISEIRKKHFDKIIDNHVENQNRLKTEIANLRQELQRERLAHAITTSTLQDMTKETQRMREKIKEISGMITQPPTEEIFNTSDISNYERTPGNSSVSVYRQPTIQRHSSNMTSVSQQRPNYQQDPSRRYQDSSQSYYETSQRHIMQQRRLQSQSPASANNGAPSGNVMVVRPIAHVSRVPIQPHLAPPQVAQPMQRLSLPDPKAVKFPAIPQPNPSMGHTCQSSGPYPQQLIDQTKPNDNTIMLCVPYVPHGFVISSGDSTRLPILPKMLTSLMKTPDLVVTISSTAKDFGENWQIGGKINYEYMGMLDKKTIQVFVQVASLKATGMSGRPNPDNPTDCLNWGISKAWPCKAKSHRFRVTFHQAQQIPINDRITVVVVARNTATGAIEVSEAVYLNLTA
uniref:BHLH domain-containing protein n=1 Tax=Caenorhabditis tropicalis TaxID=1561998 RepID=A0A1I7T0T9_9PELO